MYLLRHKPQWEYCCCLQNKKRSTSQNLFVNKSHIADLKCPGYVQFQGHQSFTISSNTHTHRRKHTTTWESLCPPPTHPAEPLPSLIHPHQGPECLLSRSAPHYLLSFRVPCSPLWGHLVFGVSVFFWGCSAFSIAACSVKLKRVLAGSRC